MQRHALTDEQWARLQPLLPFRAAGRKATRGDRLFLDAVIFRTKTGIQWRDLPERFGNWKTVYNRFRNWAQKDCWAQIFRELRIDVDETASIADGSVVRAHQDASGEKGGSNAMLWDALVEVFQPSSTRSSTRKAGRSTSRSRRVNATK
jgi:transposase